MDNKTAIQSVQMRQMIAASNMSLATSTLLAAILAYMQRDVIDFSVVIGWFTLIVLVMLSRAALVMAYHRTPVDGGAATHARLVRFRFGVLAAGVVWGSAGFLLFPAHHPQHQMFLIFVVAGLTAGGVVSYSADLLSGIIFSVSVIVPLVARLFVDGDSMSVAMAMALMLYLGFMIMSLRHINRNICENITLRLEAVAREKIVRANEERYRLLLDHSPVGIFHYDASLVITYCNDRFAEMLQNSIERIIGLDMKHLKDQSFLPTLRQTLKGESAYYEGHYSATFSDARGWTAMTCAPLRDDRGEIAGGIAIVQDITERKEHEEELQRSNVDLEQFSYAVSHDMRQPLRMISSYLQLIEIGLADKLDSEKRGYFDSAIEGAKRIDQMLVDLLEYSRVGRKGKPLDWIESRAVLDEALQFLQPAIAEAQAKLSIAGEWPRILASHDEMLMLLQNLIGNAAKYRIAGQTPEITVTGEIVENEWHLSVADNGVGIIPDQIKRLFQMFQRLHTRAVYEGTGIGLALCRKIAEHHKGHIWAESEGEGKGSRFCVALPVLRRRRP